jgi:hypothetical protein
METLFGGLEVRRLTRTQRRVLRDDFGLDLIIEAFEMSKATGEFAFETKKIDALLDVAYPDKLEVLEKLSPLELCSLYQEVFSATMKSEADFEKKS